MREKRQLKKVSGSTKKTQPLENMNLKTGESTYVKCNEAKKCKKAKVLIWPPSTVWKKNMGWRKGDKNRCSPAGENGKKKKWERWSGIVQVSNSHLQRGGKGDGRGAEATRSSDLGLLEVVVGSIGGWGGGGGGGESRCQCRGSSWSCCCCCWGAGSVFRQLLVKTALWRLGGVRVKSTDAV